MHILIISSEHFITKDCLLGGIFQLHQAKALKKAGHNVGVLSSDIFLPRDLLKKYEYKKIETFDGINIVRSYKKTFIPNRLRINSEEAYKTKQILLGLQVYEKYVKKYGVPDILHAHNFFYAGFVAEAIKKKHKIPYIVTEHSSAYARGFIDEKLNQDLIKCANNSNAVTAVSRAFASLLKKRFNLTNISVLPNILDNTFLKKGSYTKDSNKFIFLNIASLDENKNQKLLIRAFAKQFKNKKVNLRIGGSGYLENDLKELTKSLGVDNQIYFLDQLSQEEVKKEMTQANCFVLTSNYETFGVVLIESLACGTPIISTKSGGPEDIVNDRNGLLVEVENQTELEDAMKSMYHNIEKYDKDELKNYAKKNFGKTTFIKNVMRLYNVALKGKYDNNH